MTTEEGLVQCVGCDHAFTPDAPDPEHTEPKKVKEETKDPIPVSYVCEACGETMTLYWGIPDHE